MVLARPTEIENYYIYVEIEVTWGILTNNNILEFK